MKFESLNAVVFTLGFLVPGFVWSAVLSMFIPRRARQAELHFLELFTLSCVNNAIWLWLFIYFVSVDYFTREPLTASLWIFVALFCSPVVLGLLSGFAAQKEFLGRFLRTLGFRTVHYIRAAWEWHFSRQQPAWVVATLKDGSIVYGYFGPRSFAGDDPKDLYLEKVFKLTNHGLESDQNNHGILIAADQISMLEFYKDKDFEYDEAD